MPNNTLMAERRASLEWAIEAAVTCGYTSDADVLRGLLAELSAAHPGQPEPIAWESTTVAYTKYITDERYQKFSPEVRKWYKPYRCSACSEPRAEVTDIARLNWLRDESCDLRCIDIPTGAGDSEVRWVVVQHHMSKPHEREIGRSHSEDPREAIDAARTGASS
ncbi:hypothetical protein [Burkholderia cepacia]|uniref:hypothetical protein n=1 Tax=Burkholderia cepacia TaxID=292 RepID=UPI001F1E1602|nr:hypothetical protein [Burkholderia cepacia]UIY58159.1 hypothetical protein LZ568_08070 [Burkholderia cepacia]